MGDELILNHFFTTRVLASQNQCYKTVVNRFVQDAKGKTNSEIISEIYELMRKGHRCEYFYQNTLLNKFLLSGGNNTQSTALTQLPISKSRADFIVIDDKATVYEIKTELDTFERLKTQLSNYFKAFNRVCVVTSENKYQNAVETLSNTPVGIYVLDSQNHISKKMCKEPVEDNSKLEHVALFKLLRKYEYENIVKQYFNMLPDAAPAFYYNVCLDLFRKIPILDAHAMVMSELKKRNHIKYMDAFNSVPYALKSLAYFSYNTKKNLNSLLNFLGKNFI
ncbi:hypothetical protein HMPREF9435_1035 [Gardnerella vaginalis 315-A]|uniref:sce7726 family protein n=1 Tax=Gardnerella vaginalis TaxID=2702 RepID=UPI00020D6FD5|nr:sce7726 family protein [Gardnerella vaginalis]EGL14241.1 hypothetical protein HMPREF9435_1035 [Gardnerella vaginalis 315-A]